MTAANQLAAWAADVGGATPKKAGWRINEWHPAAGVSRSKTYELLASGALKSVKLGTCRIITTSPGDYLASLAAE